MNRLRRIIVTLPAVVVIAALLAGPAPAGDLDSPSAPGATSSYSLENLYNRLDTGTAGTQSVFTEPAAGPTTGTMHDINEIMARAPGKDDANGAAADHVLSGKIYWGLITGGWGILTGTMTDVGAQDITPGTSAQAIFQGYHDGSGAVAGDTDLTAGNIASGVQIFGVTGTAVLSTGDASAGDVLTGKTFSNAGASGITGTMTDNGAGETITPGTSDHAVAAGYWSSANTVSGDANLVAGNIRSGVTIFGVEGSRHGGCDCSEGTLNGTRWCDNGDGTVTDLTTCLVWLQKADWGGEKPWEDCVTRDDVHTRAGLLADGSSGANLHDGSSVGDWRLPTKTELTRLTNGTEPVRSATPRTFTGVMSAYYWTSSSYTSGEATMLNLSDGDMSWDMKPDAHYVWPVRSGN